MADQTAQHALNDFLQLELLHSLGSYGVVAHFLGLLEQRVRGRLDQGRFPTLFPGDAIGAMQRYNRALRDNLHRPAHLRSDYSRFQEEADPDGEGRHRPPRHPAPNPLAPVPKALGQWVVDFYATVLYALDAADRDDDNASTRPAQRLGRRLMKIHDPARRGLTEPDPDLLTGRRERMRQRLERAETCLGMDGRRNRSQAIVDDHLERRGGHRLHTAVVWAFVEAHVGMHDVEHLTSHSFGDQAQFRTESDPIVTAHLNRSIVLNTFVYVAARTVPWIFAADEQERDYVFEHYDRCCETLTPTYCMWIAHQLSLLALHRRAYTWSLRGEPDNAYRDLYKLTRLVRGIERTLDQRVSRARGAELFLDGLAALADHHTGRLYRVQHAYATAVRHFQRASHRLTSLEQLGGAEEPVRNAPEPTAREAVRDSRWRVNLLMNQGKAHYECGDLKKSLLCYARAWRAFLDLAVSESMAVVANVDVIDSIVRWLHHVQDDPDLDTLEVAIRFRPLVEQFGMVTGPTHLRLLSAEVMMRLGHLLYVLKLPEGPGDPAAGGVRVDHRLAYRCLLRAAWLDQYSTLTAGDIRKIRRASADAASAVALEDVRDLHEDEPRAPSIPMQWPAGGERFEEAARVIEYILQLWLDDSRKGDEATDEERIARDLLDAFLAHTDSSNVKLAQVYRYLMRMAEHRRRAVVGSAQEPPGEPSPATLELICMRRYSSFFPFLPRPSAFRVLGGGYFVRAVELEVPPFGIAIDPGPNFLDNLYRCGYCIEDINMIVVTHDHADHVAALDALLSLMNYRRILHASMFEPDRKLLILGNRGIVDRYRYLNRRTRVRVVELGAQELPPEKVYPWPPSLRIEPVESVGHIDARDQLAKGFLLRIGEGDAESTMLFTSDTGTPPDLLTDGDGDVDADEPTLTTLLDQAHVVMAHLSSVPLPELRKLAGLEEPPASLDELRELEGIWTITREQAERAPKDSLQMLRQRFLLRQLQFGFHSLPKDDDPDKLGVTPFSLRERFREQPESHLYLSGLLAIGRRMLRSPRGRLLLVGELREELGAFRTRIAGALNDELFTGEDAPRALTADIGLKVRVRGGDVEVLCTTCDLDNDLVDAERYWPPHKIGEVCVKGEDEGVFYTCRQHDPRKQPRQMWIERVERYDPFGP